MNWEDSPEDARFRQEVRRFLRDSFPSGYAADPDAENSLEPEDVWGYQWQVDRHCADPLRRESARQWATALAERGWIAPRWPAEFGGAGLSVVAEFILHEEMMRAGVPVVNGIGAFLLGPTLLEFGSAEQRARHLPAIARGETAWAQCFSEPEAGSDLASVRTRAVRVGEHYLVSGQKVWTSLAAQADWFFALVRTDPEEPRHRGLSLVLIDAGAPGVTVRPIEDIRGATPFAEVFFDEVRVPVGDRVGAENGGWRVAMGALSFERAGIGASVKLEQALHRLVSHVAADGPRDPAVRREIAQRYVESRVASNLARYTASVQAAESVPGYEASVNQLFCAELNQRVARTAARACGVEGQLVRGEHAPLGGVFARMRMDAVAATFLGGTTEIQRRVIATRGLGLPRS